MKEIKLIKGSPERVAALTRLKEYVVHCIIKAELEAVLPLIQDLGPKDAEWLLNQRIGIAAVVGFMKSRQGLADYFNKNLTKVKK